MAPSIRFTILYAEKKSIVDDFWRVGQFVEFAGDREGALKAYKSANSGLLSHNNIYQVSDHAIALTDKELDQHREVLDMTFKSDKEFETVIGELFNTEVRTETTLVQR